MLICKLLCITVIVCFIVDVSGVVDHAKTAFFRFLYGKKVPYRDYTLKPFDCSLCMTFWSCNFWLLYQGEFTLYTLCLVCLLALISENVSYFLFWIKDTLGWIINKLSDFINE